MATFEIYDELLSPLYTTLKDDTRFNGVEIAYDRSDDVPPPDRMPIIQIFPESPWEDGSRGSGSYSFQTRRLYIRMGIVLWVYDARSEIELDKHLFHIAGDLLDFLWEKREWRPGVYVRGNQDIAWDVAFGVARGGGFVGAQRLSVQFEMFSG